MAAIPEQALLDIAIDVGITDPVILDQVKRQARRNRRSALDELCLQQRLPHSVLYQAYASSLNVSFIGRRNIQPNVSLLKKLPWGLLRRNPLLPMIEDGETPILVVSNPADQDSIDKAMQLLAWPNADIAMAAESIITTLLGMYKPTLDAVETEASNFSPVEVLSRIFLSAFLNRASDIHLVPEKEGLGVQFRVDGQLSDYPDYYSSDQGQLLTSRLKVLANLDISEQRIPQDGGFTHTMNDGQSFDNRVATIPTIWGERSTIRLLATESKPLKFSTLDMHPDVFKEFNATVHQPNGIVLITGPTGSGKSSTLYAVLDDISGEHSNILTVEDPVERVMPKITQVKVTSKISFAAALRSFLRHDPDVIMVGEIRDGETAGIALKAAMTGHLVLSTVHTNTAAGAVARMVDLGTEPYLIGSTLLAAVAQRLVRRLCPHCRQPAHLSSEQAAYFALTSNLDQAIFQAVGCAHCLNSGYLGRIALFEYIKIDYKTGKLIAEGAREEEWLPSSPFFWSLKQDGCEKVLAGKTSFDEIFRVVRD